MSADPAIADLSFEDALKRLEAIVHRLESGEASLDQSIDLYAEGDRLRAQCEARQYTRLQVENFFIPFFSPFLLPKGWSTSTRGGFRRSRAQNSFFVPFLLSFLLLCGPRKGLVVGTSPRGEYNIDFSWDFRSSSTQAQYFFSPLLFHLPSFHPFYFLFSFLWP